MCNMRDGLCVQVGTDMMETTIQLLDAAVKNEVFGCRRPCAFSLVCI